MDNPKKTGKGSSNGEAAQTAGAGKGHQDGSNKKRKAEVSSEDASLLEEAHRLGRELAKRGLLSEGHKALDAAGKLIDNERRADAALAAFMKKRGITEDTDLFTPVPPNEDCPICMVTLPVKENLTAFMACCDRIICDACDIYSTKAHIKINTERKASGKPPIPFLCAFCRRPFDDDSAKNDAEYVQRLQKRAKANNDAEAAHQLANEYEDGDIVDKNEEMAFDYRIRAAELGSLDAFHRLALYLEGGDDFFFKNERKCLRYFEVAARGGCYMAHYNLGGKELQVGSYSLALKHFHLAAAAGYEPALNKIQDICRKKNAFDGEYTQASKEFKRAKEDQTTENREKWAKREKEKEEKKKKQQQQQQQKKK